MARSRALLAAFHFAVLTASFGGSHVARADDPPADRQTTAVAKELFDEGLKLMDAGKYVEACAKFAASHQSAAKVSTLLNLGNCYEKTGQLASAWGTYNEAIALARRTSRADYETFAQQRITAIEPKLVRLSIKVDADARIDGLVVKRDGVAVAAGGWDAAVPVDPGKHIVSATAPKKKAWERSIVVDESTPLTTIVVTGLEDAPVETPPPTPTVIAPPPVIEPERATRPPDAPPPIFWTTQRTAGLALAGGGAVALGVGAILGLVAKSSYDDARGQCTHAPDACPQSAIDQSSRAYSMATAATVLFVVGGLAIAGGGTLYFTASGGGVRGTF